MPATLSAAWRSRSEIPGRWPENAQSLRFASVYGMTIEAATAAAIHRNKHLLKGIAAERILVELTKMLCAQGAAGVLRDFADVLAVPIPELTPMFGFPQHNPHHTRMSGTIPSRSLKVSP